MALMVFCLGAAYDKSPIDPVDISPLQRPTRAIVPIFTLSVPHFHAYYALVYR